MGCDASGIARVTIASRIARVALPGSIQMMPAVVASSSHATRTKRPASGGSCRMTCRLCTRSAMSDVSRLWK